MEVIMSIENSTPAETKPKKIGRTVLAKYFHDNGYEPMMPITLCL